jgi:hypothetical protein
MLIFLTAGRAGSYTYKFIRRIGRVNVTVVAPFVL